MFLSLNSFSFCNMTQKILQFQCMVVSCVCEHLSALMHSGFSINPMCAPLFPLQIDKTEGSSYWLMTAECFCVCAWSSFSPSLIKQPASSYNTLFCSVCCWKKIPLHIGVYSHFLLFPCSINIGIISLSNFCLKPVSHGWSWQIFTWKK